jgi:hypothetical protein
VCLPAHFGRHVSAPAACKATAHLLVVDAVPPQCLLLTAHTPACYFLLQLSTHTNWSFVAVNTALLVMLVVAAVMEVLLPRVPN